MSSDDGVLIINTSKEDVDFSTQSVDNDVINYENFDHDVDIEEYDPFYENNYEDDDKDDEDDFLVINITVNEVNISLINSFMEIFHLFLYLFLLFFKVSELMECVPDLNLSPLATPPAQLTNTSSSPSASDSSSSDSSRRLRLDGTNRFQE